jgi:hypothetical protein
MTEQSWTERPRAGQPENDRLERKIRIGLRVSEAERLEIAEQAETSRLTVSEYVRRRILGKRIIPKTDLAALAELRRLGGLLKHVHLETRGVYSELTANAIRALEVYARTLERSHKETREKNRGTGPP